MSLYKKKDKRSFQLYPNEIFAKLEFDKVLSLLEENCLSPLGRAHVNNIQFYTEADDINVFLHETREFLLLLENPNKEFPQSNYLDLKDELKLIGLENAVLSEHQLFQLLKVVAVVQQIIDFFGGEDNEARELYVHLFRVVKKYEIDREILNELKRVIDDEGKIKSNASDQLGIIRNQITSKYQELNRQFRAVLHDLKKRGWLVDEGESIRNGRRVLSVQSEFKRKVKGFILDVSASGKTTFIEPDSTLQVNNALVELHNDERREIQRILRTLTAKLKPHLSAFDGYQVLLGKLDFTRAKAKLAKKIEAVQPSISAERVIELNEVRHPLLYLINQEAKKETVPLSMRLSIADRILLISGPNAGGKSVALKTVGLLQLMFQSGMLIPAEEGTRLCIFKSILVDIGDEQSLENDLSTYSSRLKNMKHFIDFANNQSLVLIDEFGSGTDPKFGGAIAESVLDELNKKRVYGVITTHYSNLKIFASQTSGVVNGAMTFSKEKLAPMYSLETGKPGSSFAFELAGKSHLKKEVIENAKTLVGDEYKEFDQLLSSLQMEKQDLEERTQVIAQREQKFKSREDHFNIKLKDFDKKRKTLLLEAEQEALNKVKETNKRLENLMREWKEDMASKEKAAAIRKEIAAIKEDSEKKVEIFKDVVLHKESKGILEVGASVQLRSGGRTGKLVELRNNDALVEFGSMKTKVKLKELVVVETRTSTPTKTTYQSEYTNLSRVAAFTNNIDVRGMRVEEAIAKVEALIDQALIVNADELKVIHGRGTGALKRTIRNTFRRSSAVKKIRDEDPEYGGDAVSIIELT